MAAAIYEKSQCDIKNLSTYVQKDWKIQGFRMTNKGCDKDVRNKKVNN